MTDDQQAARRERARATVRESRDDGRVAPFGAIRDLGEVARYQRVIASDAGVQQSEVAVPMYGGLPPFLSPMSSPESVLWRTHPIFRIPTSLVVPTFNESRFGEGHLASMVSASYTIRLALTINACGGLDDELRWTNSDLHEPNIFPPLLEAMSLAMYRVRITDADEREDIRIAVLALLIECVDHYQLAPDSIAEPGGTATAQMWLDKHAQYTNPHHQLTRYPSVPSYRHIADRFGELNDALYRLGSLRQGSRFDYIASMVNEFSDLRTVISLIDLTAQACMYPHRFYPNLLIRTAFGASSDDAHDKGKLDDVWSAVEQADSSIASDAVRAVNERVLSRWQEMRKSFVELGLNRTFNSASDMDHTLGVERRIERWGEDDLYRHPHELSPEELATLLSELDGDAKPVSARSATSRHANAKRDEASKPDLTDGIDWDVDLTQEDTDPEDELAQILKDF